MVPQMVSMGPMGQSMGQPAGPMGTQVPIETQVPIQSQVPIETQVQIQPQVQVQPQVQPQVQQQVQQQMPQASQMGGASNAFMLPSPILPGGAMLAVDTSQSAMAQDGLIMEAGSRRRRAPSFGDSFEMPRMPSMPSMGSMAGTISVTKLE